MRTEFGNNEYSGQGREYKLYPSPDYKFLEQIASHERPIPFDTGVSLLVDAVYNDQSLATKRNKASSIKQRFLRMGISGLVEDRKDLRVPTGMLLFVYDDLIARKNVLRRFNWNTTKGGYIMLGQASTMMCALNDMPRAEAQEHLVSQIIKDYPSMIIAKDILTNKINIPSKYLLDVFDEKYEDIVEKRRIEKAIKKYELTPREFALLHMSAKGKTHGEIDKLLSLSSHVTSTVVTSLKKKLDCDNRMSLVFRYYDSFEVPDADALKSNKPITETEAETLSIIFRGDTNLDIARFLNTNLTAVKANNTKLYEKLNVEDRYAATVKCTKALQWFRLKFTNSEQVILDEFINGKTLLEISESNNYYIETLLDCRKKIFSMLDSISNNHPNTASFINQLL